MRGDPNAVPEASALPWPMPHAFDNERRWLDCLLEREILRLRARYELSLDELRGLYISDRQVDQLLREHVSELVDSTGASLAHDPVGALTSQAALWRACFAADSPLALLGERLGLSDADLELVFVVFAPELDLRYETLYAYLNNDIGRKSATADLAQRLLGRVRAALHTLRAAGIFTLADPDERRSSLAQCVTVAPAVAQFMLGIAPGPRLEPVFATPVPTMAGELIACRGSDPERQAHWATRMLLARGRHGLHIAPEALLGNDNPALVARLAGAAIVLHEPGLAEREQGHAERLATALQRSCDAGLTLLWLVPGAWQAGPSLGALPLTVCELAPALLHEREAAWTSAIGQAPLGAGIGSAAPASTLAARFSFSGGRIRQAVQAAQALLDADPALGHGGAALDRAARQLAAQSLAQVAQYATKPHRWAQLVLPPTTLQLLREVAAAIAAREQVFRTWNMQGRTGRSSGLMLLFSGTSGTGKTMAASVLANHVGLDLFRIDLAGVVSKYIGETEKNLSRIFAAAHEADAILLIDEADALLGKRAEVKDAHDRYANIEVAYLLQKMEEHDGVVILASNLPKNLDQAFSRRMHYVVEFARPGAGLREHLWRGMFPPEVPLDTDLDYAFLAGQFELTGGEIQTIALEAAFLAAGEGSRVGMAQLMRAMARRQTKHGDPGVAARFRVYQDTLEQGRA